MDIVNKDLTKKVLAALNPNKIFDEDQLEKQTALTRIMRPFGKQMEDEAQQKVIKESKKATNQLIAQRSKELADKKLGEQRLTLEKGLADKIEEFNSSFAKQSELIQNAINTSNVESFRENINSLLILSKNTLEFRNKYKKQLKNNTTFNNVLNNLNKLAISSDDFYRKNIGQQATMENSDNYKKIKNLINRTRKNMKNLNTRKTR